MKKILVISKLMLVLMLLTSCTSFETRDGLYSDDNEVIEVAEDVDVTIEAMDIFDDEIALAPGDAFVEGFDLSSFTDAGNRFIDRLESDVTGTLKKDRGYEDLLAASQVPGNDLMAVVNVDLEHMMQFDDGDWEDRRTEYADNGGYIVSSFSSEGGIYQYNLRYNDNDGTYRVVEVIYDSVMAHYDYSSDSYDAEGIFNYSVQQQFCSDGEGGYFYQALRQSIVDGTERISFSHFNDAGYVTYTSPSLGKKLIETFDVNIYEEIPSSISAMVGDYSGLYMFSNEDGSFDYVSVD